MTVKRNILLFEKAICMVKILKGIQKHCDVVRNDQCCTNYGFQVVASLWYSAISFSQTHPWHQGSCHNLITRSSLMKKIVGPLLLRILCVILHTSYLSVLLTILFRISWLWLSWAIHRTAASVRKVTVGTAPKFRCSERAEKRKEVFSLLSNN